MNQFYCLALYSKNESRYFNTLEAALQAGGEDVQKDDVIYRMDLQNGEYEIVEEYDVS